MLQKRSTPSLIAILAIVAIAHAPFARAADGPDEVGEMMKSLQGKWRMVALTVNGQKLGEKDYGVSVLVHEGKTQRLLINGLVRESFDVAVRPGAESAEIDLTFADGPMKGEKVPGIYKLDGDQLTVCTNLRAGRRPKHFASEEGSFDNLAVYERQEP